MSDADELLDLIEKGIVEHGGDLGGWTRRDEDKLQLFDGRVTLQATIMEADHPGTVHAHVYVTLHEHEAEVLDCCVFGIGEERESALAEAAVIWLTCVAGPVKSFIDNRPVCMTCQAGVADGDISQGYSPGDYGLTGLNAFVGPSIARAIEDEQVQEMIDDTKPWFLYAAEAAAPRRVHMAKSIILSEGDKGWTRELEIDGHEVSHHDPNWPAGVRGPDFGYLTRYAVFEFPLDSSEISRRAELERTIRHFAENFSVHQSTDELLESMIGQGFDPQLVHETEAVSTLAFGRILFEQRGVKYHPHIHRIRADGKIDRNIPLMSLPAYSRARAIIAELAETMPQDELLDLCSYSAESNAILQVLESQEGEFDFTQLTMSPSMVPDPDVSSEVMQAALAELDIHSPPAEGDHNKPWWKFW